MLTIFEMTFPVDNSVVQKGRQNCNELKQQQSPHTAVNETQNSLALLDKLPELAVHQ